jgi:hypothetical protein
VRVLGLILVTVGVVCLLLALNMDTSVASYGSLYGPSRVENIGLIAQRQNYLFVSGLVILVGVLLAIFGGRKTDDAGAAAASPVQPTEPPADRNLDNDAYRLWLASTYSIARNDVFDRFVMGERTFPTLDDALAHAHAAQIQKAVQAAAIAQQAAEERRRYREQLELLRAEQEERWQRNKPRVIAAAVVGLTLFLVATPFLYRAAKDADQRRQAEEARKQRELKGEVARLGLPLIETATGITIKNVASGHSDDTWCNDRSGALVSFDTPMQPKDVVAFYDKRWPGGEDPYASIEQDKDNLTRVYKPGNLGEVDLYTFAGGEGASNYLCKIGASVSAKFDQSSASSGPVVANTSSDPLEGIASAATYDAEDAAADDAYTEAENAADAAAADAAAAARAAGATQ